MVIHVAERVASAIGAESTVIATEDRRIVDCAREFGFNAVITSDNATNGTARVWDVAQQMRADVYLNVQGDEPMVKPDDIAMILQKKISMPGYVINGMCPLGPQEDPVNVNIPKVLAADDGRLLYMSRLPIPGRKDPGVGAPKYMKQVCIYAFSFDELRRFAVPDQKTPAEKFEDIEILRFLERGVPVQMVEVSGGSLAVDIPEDVAAVEAAIGRAPGQA